MNERDEDSKEIILKIGPQEYFFQILSDVNKKSLNNFSREVIFYLSEVMGSFILSQNFFELEEGKFKDKILGTKFLEAKNKSKKPKMRAFKEIGDTALFLSGYFSASLNKKIIDESYYQKLGAMAYDQLNDLVPSFYDVPRFYSGLAQSFQGLSNLLTILAEQQSENSQDGDLGLIINFQCPKVS